MERRLNEFADMFAAGIDLAEDEAEIFLDLIITEADETLIGAVLKAWNAKGTTESEIFALARLMRDRCVPVRSRHSVFIDAVGTGGSHAKTFNVSTASAFVIAGTGVPVAKHGNRAATSASGSADVLAQLGVNPAVDAETAERCLNEIGICFMFAPNFHRLSPTLGKVRRELGVPTIFNNLGPLCNPADAPHQVIGVWSLERLVPTARALARLGTNRSWVVHGSDGLDEITISGRTHVAEVRGEKVREFEIGPEDFGLACNSIDHLRTDSSKHSAAIIRSLLASDRTGVVAADLVVANAAAAIFLTGNATDLKSGAEAARESLASGAALRKLQDLSAATSV